MITLLRKKLATLPLLTLIGVGVLIAVANYQPGTFLSGWDTLHPEFNLSLYSERIVFGAWQSHQGLGAPAAQAHLAELPRLPFLWLLTAVLPLSMVRYAVFLSLFILGGVGVYAFIKQAIFENKNQALYGWAAAAGGLFYMCNLGTLQHFYVPLEMFAVHFATIGFLLLALYKSIKQGGIINYAWFFLIQILSSPSAHTATLFYMYQGIMFAYAFFLLFTTHRHSLVTGMKRFLLLAGLTLTAHAYWLIPNLYYVFEHRTYVQDAKISRLFSSEAFWQNQAFGQLQDVLIFKNFLFNWKDYDFRLTTFIDLFNEWNIYLNQVGYFFVYSLSALAIAGLGLLIFRPKLHVHLWLSFFFLVPLFFLVNLNFPFTPFYDYVRNNFSFLEETLRFPFTKFSIVFILSMSLGFGYIVALFLNAVTKLTKDSVGSNVISGSIISIIFLSILLGSWPMVTGHLISPQMKVAYPTDYFELFDWFKQQPAHARIAKLPLNTFWGWNYYSWPINGVAQGYQGAGFLWFGIPQPLLDREFDRWVATNEYFYHELAQAQYAANPEMFSKLLQKYQVKYLLFDNSIIDPERLAAEVYKEKFQNLIKNNPAIRLAATFGSVEVYQVADITTELISSPETTLLTAKPGYARIDYAFNQFGNYLFDENASVVSPFSNVTAERLSQSSVDTNGNIVIESQFPVSGSIVIPKWSSFNHSIPVKIFGQFDQITQEIVLEIEPSYPTLSVGDRSIDLAYYLATPSLTITKEVAVETEIDSFVLTLNDTLMEMPNTNKRTFIGPSMLSLVDTTTLDIAPATLTFEQTLELAPSIATISLSPEDLNGILLEEQGILASDNQVHLLVTIPTLQSFEEQTKSWTEYKDQTIVSCSNELGTTNVGLEGASFVFSSANKGIACEKFTFPTEANQDYLIRTKSTNYQGMPLKIAVNETSKNERYLEEIVEQKTETSVFTVLGNRNLDDIELDVASISFGSIETRNALNEMRVYPVPLRWLANITSEKGQPVSLPPLSNYQARTVVPHIYWITVSNQNANSPLVLAESFDRGWLAITLKPTVTVLPHTSFNDWANAWIIPRGSYEIVIFYWPELASFAGIVLLGITGIILLVATLKARNMQYRQ